MKTKDIGQLSYEINKYRSCDVKIENLLLLASYEELSPDLEQFKIDYFTQLVGAKLMQNR